MPLIVREGLACVCVLVLACMFVWVGDTFAQGGVGASGIRPAPPTRPSGQPPTLSYQSRLQTFGSQPLRFEANQGQTDPQVNFLSRGRGYTLWLTPTEAVLSFRERACPVLRMELVGANPRAKASGLDPVPGRSNYFIGKDPKKWRTDIPNYSKVHYDDIYPGIGLSYYGTDRGQLEYDVIVAPGANPGAIRLRFEGASELEVNEQGDISVHAPGRVEAPGAELRLHRPFAYQVVNGNRKEVPARYVLRGKKEASFHLDSYDSSKTLIIDPVLEYSTYLGGSGDDSGASIAVDGGGHAYIVGTTSSVNFPVSGSLQAALTGHSDAFVTKLNAMGTAPVYSTYLGGSGGETGAGIAVDAAGNAYITGTSASVDFPTTAGAFQSAFGAGATDTFLAKLDAQGMALAYSTYLGGSDLDFGSAVALDPAGHAYVTGTTVSTNFPVTSGAFQTVAPVFVRDNVRVNAFLTKIDASQAGMASTVYSTYLGGTFSDGGAGIAVDSAGNAYVTGFTDSNDFPVSAGAPLPHRIGGTIDAFVTKMNAAGSAIVYSTYLGGNSNDTGNAIAVDSAGNAHVTGNTPSTDFPTTPGAFQTVQAGGAGNLGDAFVTKLNASGTAFLYSTYFGGSSAEIGLAIAVDAEGSAYLTGNTGSANFPTTPEARQPNFGGNFSLLGFGGGDAFLTKLDPTGSSLAYSSYLGGAGDETGYGIAVQGSTNVYLTGSVNSPNFTTTAGVIQPAPGGAGDAFVAKFGFHCVPPPAGMVGWWPGDGTAEDIAGSNDGMLGGAATFGAGRVGQAFSLNGVDAYVRVPHHPSLNTPDGLTVDAWILPRSSGGARDIASKWNDPTGQWSWIFKLHNDGTGRLRIEVSRGDHNALGDLGGATRLPLNTWSHVAATFDRVSGRLRLYVNGRLDSQGTARFIGVPINNSGTDLLIGAVNGQTTPPVEHFDGFIDELEVSNRELSAEEIQAIFAAGSASKCRNQPPVADAGADQRVECSSHAGTPVTLDGSASSDPDGNPLRFEWRDADGNIVGTAAPVNLTLPLGVHTFTLNIDDGQGGIAGDSVNVIVQDTTPPVLTLAADSVTVVVPTASATGAVVDVLAASGARAGDACDPAPAITRNGPADGFFPIGITILTVTATDHSGNSSQARFTVQVVYNSSGFLAPIRSDGSSVFKSGRVILIRFQLTAADGTFVSNAAATLAVFKVTDDVLGTVEVESAGNANQDNAFRYDPDTNQYIFNLSSSGYSAGTYLLRVLLNDGTIHDVLVSVR